MDQQADENKVQAGAALQSTTSDRLLGQTIGEKYLLERLVGTGAKGRVYVANQTALDHPVAIKVLLEEAEDEHEERFRQEAQALLKLRHSSIVCVRDFGYHEFRPYIVMDLVDGLSLEALLKKQGRLSDAEARSIFAQCAAGLAHAHEQGILHRDIKPANIMLRRQGEEYLVSLVDFGLAKAYSLDGKSLSGLTATGSLVGTPQYMSPEQCTGTDLDPRSDIYSLGCVMYEAISGRQCFSATGLFDCLYKQINEMPAPFHEIKSDTPVRSTLEDVIMRCLAKNRDQRYSSAAALGAALAATSDISMSSTLAGISRWKRIASQKLAKQKGSIPSIPTITLTPVKTFDRAMAALMDASLVASIGAFWLILVHLLAQTFLKDSLRDPFPSVQLLIPLLIGDWFAGGLLLIPLMLYWSSRMPLDPTNQPHLWFGLVMVVGLYAYGAGMWFYRAGLESWHTQATLGKMMLGLVVTDKNGIRLTFGEALWRSITRVFTLALFIDAARFIFYVLAKREKPRAAFRQIVLVPAHDWIAHSQVRQQDDSTAKLDFRYPTGVAIASFLGVCWGNGHYFVAWLLGWLLTVMSAILWIGYVHRLCMLLQAQVREVKGVNPWLATALNVVGLGLMASVQVFSILISNGNVMTQLPASFYGALGTTPNTVVVEVLDFIASHNLLALSKESIFMVLAVSTVVIFTIYLWLFVKLQRSLVAPGSPLKPIPAAIAASLALFPLIWFTGVASTRCMGCSLAFILAFILLGRLGRRFSSTSRL